MFKPEENFLLSRVMEGTDGTVGAVRGGESDRGPVTSFVVPHPRCPPAIASEAGLANKFSMQVCCCLSFRMAPLKLNSSGRGFRLVQTLRHLQTTATASALRIDISAGWSKGEKEVQDRRL